MPYAHGQTLSQSPIEGGIEISEEQYQQALADKLNGKLVAVKDGELQVFHETKQTVYSTENGNRSEISILDDVPEGYTTIAPLNDRQKWIDGAWVTDEVKQEKYLREQFKAERQILVDTIKVTVDGMEFDGDEVSQGRMARAIIALPEGETIVWVLADNTPVQVNKSQLTQALQLAGAAQAAVWVQ